MIVCPNCEMEIDDDSLYCDQCGQKLLFCGSCGRVGTGKRCIYCGGLMSDNSDKGVEDRQSPDLVLSNVQQGIRITMSNGDIIGRRVGEHKHLFENNRFVSGQHAQFIYSSAGGWGVVDKNSSNGTMVNGIKLLPEKLQTLKDGDTLMIANLSLKVNIQ